LEEVDFSVKEKKRSQNCDSIHILKKIPKSENSHNR